MNSTHSISEEFSRVVGLVHSDSFFQREHKRNREWWVLAKVFTSLRAVGYTVPSLARSTQSVDGDGNIPDFETLFDDGKLFCHVEITEALGDGRRKKARRELIHQGEILYQFCVPNALESLKEVLSKKLKKTYLQPVHLFVYLNIPLSEIADQGALEWYEHVFAAIDGWKDLTMDRGPFEKIYILDCTGSQVVSIFPERKVFP